MGIRRNKHTGFTIVELLIVIVIIGILAAITIAAYNGIQNRVKVAAMQSDLSQAAKAVLAYKVADSSENYPTTLALAGVKNSRNITLQYSVDNSSNPKSYCVTATDATLIGSAYFISSAQASPTVGTCANHSQNPGNPNLLANSGGETSNGINVIRTNLIPNPSFETSITGWNQRWYGNDSATGNGAVSASAARYGSQGFRKTWSSPSSGGQDVGMEYNLPVSASTSYAASAWVRTSWATTSTLWISWRDSTNTEIGTTGISNGRVSHGADAWTQVYATGTSPVNTVSASISFGPYPAAGVPISTGSTADFDGLMLSRIPSDYEYLDGSMAASGDFAYAWTGTAHASASEQRAPGLDLYGSNTNYSYPQVWQSSVWSASGSKSIGMMNRGANTDQFYQILGLNSVIQANKTYTFKARVKTTKAISDSTQLRLRFNIIGVGDKQYMPGIAGAPGEYDFKVTFDTSGMNGAVNFFRPMNSINDPGTITYWDNLMLVEGDYGGSYYQ